MAIADEAILATQIHCPWVVVGCSATAWHGEKSATAFGLIVDLIVDLFFVKEF
jgi:hypothetical protein